MAVTYTENENVQRLEAYEYNFLTAFIATHARAWMTSLLMISDFIGLSFALGVAVTLHRILRSSLRSESVLPLLPLVLIFIVTYTVRRLYPTIGLGAVEEFRRLTVTTSVIFISIAAFTFAIQSPPIYSRFIFFVSWMLSLVAVPFGRTVVRAIFSRWNLWGEPVAVIGQRDKVLEIASMLRNHPKIGLRPTIMCENSNCIPRLERSHPGNPEQARHELCPGCPVRMSRVSLVVYTDRNELPALRDTYQDVFERVILINAHDLGLSLSGVSVCKFGGMTGLEIRQDLLNRWSLLLKRVIDIAISSAALLVLSPFLGLLALLIRLDSRGPAFYKQPRLGKDGKAFGMVKFRSMYLNADEVLRSYLEKDPTLKLEWAHYQKLRNDPRITRVGRLIRRFSLDELPQLWNIFIGDMSLVGPRPIMLNQRDMYGNGFKHYVRVSPGMTGLWQISGRNKTTFVRRTEYDVYYVMNWSIWLDIYILVRTVWVVLRQEGAS